ncbi:hypothetical protein BC834DRAFT_922199 [Gloeopeniophorella convolvens]|nr:hypothetical protein BC834DRAFT_922199 [Gloeopeniophorella convolvens]
MGEPVVQSCRGIPVSEVAYTPSGLEFDRTWSIVEATSHKILTARALPKLVLVTPRIIRDPSDATSGGRLELSFPAGSGCETFSVPLRPSTSTLKTWTLVDDCSVFSFTEIDGYITQAHPTSSPDPSYCSDVLSRFVGKPVHLMYKGPRTRPAPPTWSFPKLSASVAYQDAYPILVASEESIQGVQSLVAKWCREQKDEELKRWDPKSIVIERYRPNVVFEGSGQPFAEDMWKEISIRSGKGESDQSAKFTLVSKCTRCLLPNIDPRSGVRNMSIPSKPLLQYRVDLDPGRPGYSCFGCNAVPEAPGTLCIGDVVLVDHWDAV